jgi:hypothetical protein
LCYAEGGNLDKLRSKIGRRRKYIWLKRGVIIGDRGKLKDEEFHFMICTPHEYYWGDDDIEENEMGGVCGCQLRREEKCLTGLWGRNLKERYHLEDLGIDGRII